MFIISQLPEKENFIQIPTSDPEKNIWVDKDNRFFRVVAESIDPFVGEQMLLVYPRWGKSNNSKYLLGIDFRTTRKRGDFCVAEISREIYKAKSAYTLDSALRMWAISLGENIWLQYTIYKNRQRQ